MDLISIIVPIYNVEKYLNDCIKCLIEQTYRNIEILLIDDGSTDNSGRIADEWIKKDTRIKVFHKKNGGLSDARNYGIEKAQGKYLSFIDSDDKVSNDFIEFLYNIIILNNVKISSCAFAHYYDDGTIKNVLFSNIDSKYNNIDAQILLNSMGYFNASCCNKLFEAKLFESIRFPLNVTSEDLFIMHKLIYEADGLYYNSKVKYFYRQRMGSITKNDKINYDVITAAKLSCDYYKDNNMDIILPFSYQTLIFAYLGVYNTLLCRNDKINIKQIYNEIIKYKKLFTLKNTCISRKIQIFLFFHMNWLYNFLFKIFNMIRKK